MSGKKKLQVFVSSTYADLKEERQAAVEAILTAGHIPAGMELFAAGDESQMDVIKRWIDESDVYLLVLGGRYGSIEPKSQKSYIQLEYEYAVEKSKPLFSVVIEQDYLEERVKEFGTKVIETNHPQELKLFRELVLSRMVRFWRDPRDIKLSILETLSEISRRTDLTGWIPGDQSFNAGALAEEIVRLTKENAALRERVTKLSVIPSSNDNLPYEQIYDVLSQTKFDNSEIRQEIFELGKKVSDILGHKEVALLHVFYVLSATLREGLPAPSSSIRLALISPLEDLGLVRIDKERFLASNARYYELTEGGKQFLLRLKLERNSEKAEQYRLL